MQFIISNLRLAGYGSAMLQPFPFEELSSDGQ
jgi:hypothetical protein